MSVETIPRKGRAGASRTDARAVVREIASEFRKRRLLTYSSAIAFQVISSIAPAVLCVLAVMGFLSLGDVYVRDVAPSLRGGLSPAAFTVLNDTVSRVLADGQGFWLTAGALLAVWQVSGAVRAVMDAFNAVYDLEENRSARRRYAISFALAVAVGLLLLAAIAVVSLAPLLYRDAGAVVTALLFVARWAMAAAFLLVAVGLLVRIAPATRPPIGWVSVGSLIVCGGWVLVSIGFGVYLREIADYGSAFGNLATLVIVTTYIYVSTTTFMVGALTDSLLRRELQGSRSGHG